MPPFLAKAARLILHLYPFPRGQGRIVDRTLANLHFAEERLVVRTTDGFPIEVFPNDLIGRHIYLTGQFDRTIVEVLLSFARPGDRLLDIGGNIGYVACSFLHLVPDSKVVSVEPQPAVHELLEANLKRVSSTPGRARALRVAVSDSEGWGAMIPESGNTGGSRLQTEGDPGKERVQVVSGSRLMTESGLDRLDLVKIDVEGHEETVMRGLVPVLQKCRARAIVFEHTGDLNDPASGLARTFRELDYSLLGIVKHLSRFELVPLGDLAASKRRAHDYVAVPNDKGAPRDQCCEPA